MADFTTIRAKVVATAQSIPAKLAAAAVFDHEPLIADVDLDPFAVVIPSGNENEYISTSENRRTYAFIVRIFVERKSRGVQAAEQVLEDIVDDLIDAYDLDYGLTGSALLVEAAPSRWGYVLGEKEYRTADIIVRVKTDFQAVT